MYDSIINITTTMFQISKLQHSDSFACLWRARGGLTSLMHFLRSFLLTCWLSLITDFWVNHVDNFIVLLPFFILFSRFTKFITLGSSRLISFSSYLYAPSPTIGLRRVAAGCVGDLGITLVWHSPCIESSCTSISSTSFLVIRGEITFIFPNPWDSLLSSASLPTGRYLVGVPKRNHTKVNI